MSSKPSTLRSAKRKDAPLAQDVIYRVSLGRLRRRCAVLGLALALAMLNVGSIANAQPLLRAAPQTLSVEKRQQLNADPHVMRWREARMAVDAVFESSAPVRALELNLFPDAELEARVRSAKTLESGSQFLYGTLVAGGHFTLFRSMAGILRGEFHSPAGVFTMRSLGPRRVLVKQQDLSELPVCGHDTAMERAVAPAKAPATAPLPQPRPRKSLHASTDHRGDSNPIDVPDVDVDVLVVYTLNAERSEGGENEISATIEAEIEKTNQALENSGLSHRRIKLAGMEKVNYTQSSDSLRNDNWYLASKRGDGDDPDGVLDEVHDLRKRYAADIVHLIVKERRVHCGVGGQYSLLSQEFVDRFCSSFYPNDSECTSREQKEAWMRQAFGVSAISSVCTLGNTLTHELGHNFGLDHDRYAALQYDPPLSLADPIRFPYKPYGFGYVNQNLNRPQCRKTLMSTSLDCRSKGYSNIIGELIFSSPELQLGSEESGYDPAGVEGEEWTIDLDGPVNASRAIDEVWGIVANLYHSSAVGRWFDEQKRRRSDALVSGETELLSADEAALDLSDYLGAVDGGALTYSAMVDDLDLASVSVVGSILTVTANEDGADGVVTVTATATDETGQAATLRFEVTISPRPPGGLRGWRATLATPADSA